MSWEAIEIEPTQKESIDTEALAQGFLESLQEEMGLTEGMSIATEWREEGISIVINFDFSAMSLA